MWNNQIGYTEPQINTQMTHSAAPVQQPCPNPDIINKRDTFTPGSTIYLAAYYHDQTSGQNSDFTILRPNGSVYNTWSHSGGSGGFYSASWWYWSYTIPASQPLGEWTFRTVYQGNTYEHKFYILFPTDVVNVEEKEQLLYPNPATNTLSFDAEVESIQLIDLLGRTVLNESSLPKGQLDISSLEVGLYYAKVTVAGKVHTQKISVLR
jgi:hypothetical protein